MYTSLKVTLFTVAIFMFIAVVSGTNQKNEEINWSDLPTSGFEENVTIADQDDPGNNLRRLTTYDDYMVPGQVLYAGDCLRSKHQWYRVCMQHDGNFVLYDDFRHVARWHTATHSKPNDKPYRVAVQNDGNVVMYDKYNHPIWHTGTHGSGHVKFVMQNDRNLVLYRTSDYRAMWHSKTYHCD